MITLNTIIYEKNYKEFLSNENWFFKFNHKLITKKNIIINNIVNNIELTEKINLLRSNYEFNVYYVKNHIKDCKNKFNIKIIDDFSNFYLFPQLTSILNCNNDYILNIATDCMVDISISDDYINDSINEFKNNNKCKNTLVSWCKNNHIMNNGLTIGDKEHKDTELMFNVINNSIKFDYRYNFTDQFFLGSVDFFNNVNYEITNLNHFYTGPEYGINSFEKRITIDNVFNKNYSCIYKKNDYFIHNNNYH